MIPCILFFANFGAWAAGSRQWIFAIAAVLFAVFHFHIPLKTSYGFAEAADALLLQAYTRPVVALVSSETTVGEGIFVSEMARRRTGGENIAVRASKVLADDDWTSSKYRARFASTEDVRHCLTEATPDYLVLDSSPGTRMFEHHRQLIQMVEQHPNDWRSIGRFDRVAVYKSSQPQDGSGDRLRRLLQTNLSATSLAWPVELHLACVSPSVAGLK